MRETAQGRRERDRGERNERQANENGHPAVRDGRRDGGRQWKQDERARDREGRSERETQKMDIEQ